MERTRILQKTFSLILFDLHDFGAVLRLGVMAGSCNFKCGSIGMRPAEQWRTRRTRYQPELYLQPDGTLSIQDRPRPITRSVSETGFPAEGTVFDQSQAPALLLALSAD